MLDVEPHRKLPFTSTNCFAELHVVDLCTRNGRRTIGLGRVTGAYKVKVRDMQLDIRASQSSENIYCQEQYDESSEHKQAVFRFGRRSFRLAE